MEEQVKIENPDIVFVGAGPVGLWTAIVAKLENPDVEIVMYEKYEEYRRKHVLRLNKDSFRDRPKSGKLDAIIEQFPKFTPTSQIETEFKNFAQDSGVEIRHEEIKDCAALVNRHPDAKVFVGSDGSHSLVREQVFENKKQIERDLQYIVELKYRVKGKTSKLSKLRHAIPVMSFSKYFVSEHVGKEKDGETSVSVRFFVDEKTFKKLRGKDGKGATFKKPFTLDDEKKIPKPLYKSIKAWVKWRKEIKGDNMISSRDDGLGGEKITAINLAVYASEEFVKQAHEKQWAVVGDAALGVPYFRALNAGLLCGTQLGKAMAKGDLDAYAKYAQSRFDKEISKAKFKDTGINSVQKIARNLIHGVRLTHSKLPQTRADRDATVAREVRRVITEKMTQYLIVSYLGGENEYLYHDIVDYFADERLLKRSKEYEVYLVNAIAEAKNELKESGDALEKFDSVVNKFKSSMDVDRYQKQLDIRQSRWKTAWVATLLIPVISWIPVWLWYLHRRLNEPMRAVKMTREEGVAFFNRNKQHGEGVVKSVKDMLGKLSDKQSIHQKKTGGNRLRRTYVHIGDPSELDPHDVGQAFSVGKSFLVLSSNWNKQAAKTSASLKEVRKGMKIAAK